MDPNTLHNAESAAALIGVRPSTIRHLWSTGRLPRTKVALAAAESLMHTGAALLPGLLDRKEAN